MGIDKMLLDRNDVRNCPNTCEVLVNKFEQIFVVWKKLPRGERVTGSMTLFLIGQNLTLLHDWSDQKLEKIRM